MLPNENLRNREFSINHVSGNFTHDAQSVPQNQSSEDVLPRRNPDSKGQVNETVLPKSVQPNQSSVCTRLSKNHDSSNSNTQAHDKTVICDSSSSKEFVASVSTCSQNMYQCPICVFNCNVEQGFTNHLIDVHNVTGLKSQELLEFSINSSDVQQSKDSVPAVIDSVESNKTQRKGKGSLDTENHNSSTQSLTTTSTDNVHEKTPPIMTSSAFEEHEQNDDVSIDANSSDPQQVLSCPVCKPDVLCIEIEQHLALHVPAYSCHMCTFSSNTSEEYSMHFENTYQVDQHLKPGMMGVNNHPIRILFRESNNLLTVTKFNKMKSDQKFKEIETPGNGFCFVSSLLVALAKAGVNKSFEYVIKEIMNEVEYYSGAYMWTDHES